MAGRKKKVAEPTKRSELLAPWNAVLLSSVSLLALVAAMPEPKPRRDGVVYYSDGQRHVVDIETGHVLPG